MTTHEMLIDPTEYQNIYNGVKTFLVCPHTHIGEYQVGDKIILREHNTRHQPCEGYYLFTGKELEVSVKYVDTTCVTEGCIILGITIKKQIINFDYYDQEHDPSWNGIPVKAQEETRKILMEEPETRRKFNAVMHPTME